MRAFNLLDDDHDGIIKYDISRLSEPSPSSPIMGNRSLSHPFKASDNDTIILNIDQFMEIMIRKIISHREKYGKIKFESETSSVSCFICPCKHSSEEESNNTLTNY